MAVLTASGESSEAEIGIREMHRDASVALVRVARRDPGVAEAVAAELDAMHRPFLADDLREQSTPRSGNEITS